MDNIIINKEIERSKYLINKVKKGDFSGLPEEYKLIDKQKLLKKFTDDLVYWEKIKEDKNGR